MSDEEQFTDIPKTKGFNIGRIAIVVTVIAIVGGSLAGVAILQKPGGDIDTPPEPSSITKTNNPNSIRTSDDEINKIISSSQAPKVELQQETGKVNGAESVPPIQPSEQQVSMALGSANAQPNDDLQRQITQAQNQAKIKRIQAKYAAYSSKSFINLNKENASGASNAKSSNNLNVMETSKIASAPQNTNKEYSTSKLNSPKSPYELKAGTLIPCVMISGLNSEISGTVRAQVTENVYDTINGKYMLIPQGSVLIGTYSNTVLYGNNRIGVGWSQLSFPNGDSIDLQGLPGSDLEGFNGFTDIVDNHYWQLFGTSFIMGVITGGMQYSQNNTNANVQTGGIGVTTNTSPSAGQTLSGSLGQQLGQTGLAVTNKALNVAPTIIIRQGMQFNIMLTATLILKPYK